MKFTPYPPGTVIPISDPPIIDQGVNGVRLLWGRNVYSWPSPEAYRVLAYYGTVEEE